MDLTMLSGKFYDPKPNTRMGDDGLCFFRLSVHVRQAQSLAEWNMNAYQGQEDQSTNVQLSASEEFWQLTMMLTHFDF
jgi:hypothetical protein